MKTKFLTEYVEKRKIDNQQRQLRTLEAVGDVEVICDGRRLINFCSNNYLGLAGHPILKQRAIDYINLYGTGATASRLICGNHNYHIQTETKIASLMGSESALLFNSGYQANLTLLPALADRHSLIFSDKHNHNSLVQGAKASGAKVTRYPHNNLDHLEKLLKMASEQTNTKKWIVTESIFSMDGDCCDIDRLFDLSEKYSALLYLDDAHATGVVGHNSMGLGSGKRSIDIVVGAFGKAGGVSGGFVACSQAMRDYLIQCCAGLIYSTAMSPAVVGAINGALEMIPCIDNERKQLHEKALYLRTKLQQLGFNIGQSTTHIIPLIIGSESRAMQLAALLEEQGILALAIRPPTVPEGSSCIRLSVSSKHTSEHLQYLIKVLSLKPGALFS